MASSSRQVHSYRLRQYTSPKLKHIHGWKSEQGVGAGIVITGPGTPTVKLMYRMDPRCTNYQAEAFAILKALDYVQINKENEEDNVATVHTDSRITLDSPNNADKHTKRCMRWKPENGGYVLDG